MTSQRSPYGDDGFLEPLADDLAALPGVVAVALGGSRAQGTHRPDSDWDLAVYYRGAFDPAALRALAAGRGWPGEVSPVGGWGGGVFNGGAWLTVAGHRTDVHYRDLTAVEHESAEARAGRWHWEPLMFHLAGIPSYLVVAELAVNRALRGTLPHPGGYPGPLRRTAPGEWHGRALATLGYARTGSAPRGALTEVAGAVSVAVHQSAHAVLAARGTWVTNEKTLLATAGLREADAILGALRPEPAALVAAVDRAEALCTAAVEAAAPRD
ncbi:nucleotidyltransferase domain-containing protein [Streptomyces sp. NPDC050560]|uniref:nucleotidyltransferase domain-containing protein n=1 Tax=Streptomyces sp. NPDC050560 TaxID=3365630 RepID=UPI0037A886E9